jgi:hypothetical protein
MDLGLIATPVVSDHTQPNHQGEPFAAERSYRGTTPRT